METKRFSQEDLAAGMPNGAQEAKVETGQTVKDAAKAGQKPLQDKTPKAEQKKDQKKDQTGSVAGAAVAGAAAAGAAIVGGKYLYDKYAAGENGEELAEGNAQEAMDEVAKVEAKHSAAAHHEPIPAAQPTGDEQVIDMNGDDVPEVISMDQDGDGADDMLVVNINGDDQADIVISDEDGDGQLDVVAMDINGDGEVDFIAQDVDGDGQMDIAGMDLDHDGNVDYAFIPQEDGTIAAVNIQGEETTDPLYADNNPIYDEPSDPSELLADGGAAVVMQEDEFYKPGHEDETFSEFDQNQYEDQPMAVVESESETEPEIEIEDEYAAEPEMAYEPTYEPTYEEPSYGSEDLAMDDSINDSMDDMGMTDDIDMV